MATLLSASAPQPLRRPHLYWAAVDTWVLFQRSVHQIFNAPGQLIAAMVQSVLLTVLMTILFDKAIHTDAPNYVSFIVPGIRRRTVGRFCDGLSSQSRHWRLG